MATRKTSTPKAGSARKKPAATAKKTPRKSDPVILDPPEKVEKPATKKPDVIDAKAVEVEKVETKPAKTAAAQSGPKTEQKVEEPKPESKPPEKKAIKPDPEPAPKTEPQKKAPEPAKQVEKQKSTVIPMLIGGMLAGGIGYGVAEYMRIQTPVVDPAPMERQIATLEARVLELETALANSATLTLEEDLAELRQTLADQLNTLETRLSGTETALGDALKTLEEARSAATDRINAGGEALGDAGQEVLQRIESEVAALKTRLAEQENLRETLSKRLEDLSSIATEKLEEARTEAENLAGKAVELRNNVNRDVALQKLEAALQTGQAYAAQLAEVVAALGTEAPAELSGPAASGIASLADLQAGFPKAAREGLRASIRANAGNSAGEKLQAFLQAQIGARSLEPREGDDPDAVLSRAEHALKQGDVSGALTLVKSLPEAGLSAMQSWLTGAEEHLAAMRSFEGLKGEASE